MLLPLALKGLDYRNAPLNPGFLTIIRGSSHQSMLLERIVEGVKTSALIATKEEGELHRHCMGVFMHHFKHVTHAGLQLLGDSPVSAFRALELQAHLTMGSS